MITRAPCEDRGYAGKGKRWLFSHMMPSSAHLETKSGYCGEPKISRVDSGANNEGGRP